MHKQSENHHAHTLIWNNYDKASETKKIIIKIQIFAYFIKFLW